jgi:hypothetical protein
MARLEFYRFPLSADSDFSADPIDLEIDGDSYQVGQPANATCDQRVCINEPAVESGSGRCIHLTQAYCDDNSLDSDGKQVFAPELDSNDNPVDVYEVATVTVTNVSGSPGGRRDIDVDITINRVTESFSLSADAGDYYWRVGDVSLQTNQTGTLAVFQPILSTHSEYVGVGVGKYPLNLSTPEPNP